MLLVSVNALSQVPMRPFSRNMSTMETIDWGNIKVYYALNALDINALGTYEDLQCLEIGKYSSKYYSSFVFNSDSLIADWKAKHPHAQSVPRLGELGRYPNKWLCYTYSEFYKDFRKDVLLEYVRMPYGIKNGYWSIEKNTSQNWQIKEDTLLITGYLCQKAMCYFRGRSYVAWFTMDIPIENGPWKFAGLPGLILKVYDDKKLYDFECVKIEKNKISFPIKKYSYTGYRLIDRKQLLQLVKQLNENYFEVAGIKFTSTKPLKKIDYELLELE